MSLSQSPPPLFPRSNVRRNTRKTLNRVQFLNYLPKAASNGQFDCTQANVTATTNTAIDLILETINMMNTSDKHLRTNLYNALEVLHTMAPDNGNRMHINQLPDDCLVLIFSKQFSLQKMISSFRSVCTRWKMVIESLVCAPKQSLKLFVLPKDVEEYSKKLIQFNIHTDKQYRLRHIGHQDHDLVLTGSWISNQFEASSFFRSLSIILPNVKHLVISAHDVGNTTQGLLFQLISKWPYLVRLSLFFKLKDNFQAQTSLWIKKLFYVSFNSLEYLKQLDLYGDWLMNLSKNIGSHWSEVLLQLEHLSLENAQSIQFESMLTKLGPNLKSLRLKQFDNFRDVMKKSLKTEVAIGVCELCLSDVTDLDVVKFVCEMFPKLIRLDLSFRYSSLMPRLPLDSDLITTLNQLSNLQSLSLENLKIDLDFFISSTFPSSRVKSLHLSNLSPNQTQTDGAELVRALATIFPCIEKIDYQFGIEGTGGKRTFVYRDCKVNKDYARKQFANLRECRLYYRHCWQEYVGRHDSAYTCSCSNLETDNSSDHE